MIPETYVANWEEFRAFVIDTVFDKALIEGGKIRRGKYLFRGQGNANWKLSSSFEREFQHLEPNKRDTVEDMLLSHFKKECEAYPEYRPVADSDILLMALGQHFGLPTRLLDWSESPYVAAFFAFQGHFLRAKKGFTQQERVAVWMLNRESYVWSKERGVELVSPESWHNDRLRRQYGWFTLSRTPFTSLEDYVDAFGDSQDALGKIVLPTEDARMAIADLDLMGINSRSLFVDLEGSARTSLMRTILEQDHV